MIIYKVYFDYMYSKRLKFFIPVFRKSIWYHYRIFLFKNVFKKKQNIAGYLAPSNYHFPVTPHSFPSSTSFRFQPLPTKPI